MSNNDVTPVGSVKLPLFWALCAATARLRSALAATVSCPVPVGKADSNQWRVLSYFFGGVLRHHAPPATRPRSNRFMSCSCWESRFTPMACVKLLFFGALYATTPHPRPALAATVSCHVPVGKADSHQWRVLSYFFGALYATTARPRPALAATVSCHVPAGKADSHQRRLLSYFFRGALRRHGPPATRPRSNLFMSSPCRKIRLTPTACAKLLFLGALCRRDPPSQQPFHVMFLLGKPFHTNGVC